MKNRRSELGNKTKDNSRLSMTASGPDRLIKVRPLLEDRWTRIRPARNPQWRVWEKAAAARDVARRVAAGIKSRRCISSLGAGFSVRGIAEYVAQPVRNFAHRGVNLGTGKDVRHQIVRSIGRRFRARRDGRRRAGVAGRTKVANARDLLFFELGIQTEGGGRVARNLLELVHTDHDRVSALHRLLVGIGGVLNFVLDETRFDSGERTAQGVDALDILLSAALDFIRKIFDEDTATEGIGCVGNAGFVCDDLLGAQSQTRGFFRGEPESFVLGVGMQGLRAAEHRRQRLHGDAHHVDIGLLGGKRGAGGLDVKAQHHRARMRAPKRSRMIPRTASSRPELGDLFQEIVVRVKEEGKSRRKGVHIQAGCNGRADVSDGIGEREGDFLYGGRASFANVVAADGDSVPFGYLAGRPGEQVRDDAHGRARRVDIGAARNVFLQDVILDGSGDLGQIGALVARHQDIEAQQYRGRGIDGHRRGDAGQADVFKKPLHVGQRADGYAHASHFAGGERVVGVHAHLGRQIERDGEPGDALRQEITIAAIAFFGGSEAGVSPHGPEAAAVHVRIDPAREGVLAG